MRDWKIRDLIAFDAEEGALRFAGRRVLIFDAAAMGLLRKQVIHMLGAAGARALFMQVGFAHGWHMAEAMRGHCQWESSEEWLSAGGLVHTLQGHILLRDEGAGPLSPQGATLAASSEAEQHLQHVGLAEEPVCWMLCGLASGYVSRVMGMRIQVVEDRCVGRGDAACHFIADKVPAMLRAGDLNRGLSAAADSAGAADEDAIFAWLMRGLDDTRPPTLPSMRKPANKGQGEDSGLIVHSDAMRRVVDRATRVARVDSTVLLLGESGVGKERIARLIHERSVRRAGPLVAVNCGAIAESLFASELFGHARGAFTGAAQERVGLMEAASGGTLFLDEVGELPLTMQVALLRALQERQVRRVGENHSRPIDVRVIAATNRDLGELVAAGAFRGDLYYRLKVVALKVPPLRERRLDIVPLAERFLIDAARRLGQARCVLGPAAVERLMAYPWPGNVRELENAMEHAVALAQGERIELSDLPDELGERALGRLPLARSLADVEKAHILAVLAEHEGKQAPTAAELGISAATLYRKLKSYGVLRSRQ